MPPTKRKFSQLELNKTHGHLAEVGSSKTSVVNIVQGLHDVGWLTKEAVEANSNRNTKSSLQKATKSHANANTPYGKVIQRMELPFEALKQWEYVHPMALVYYLGTISKAFFDVMKTCSTPGIPMKIIGLPWKPPATRKVQNTTSNILGFCGLASVDAANNCSMACVWGYQVHIGEGAARWCGIPHDANSFGIL